ncbi:MAG: preprotein translocase subunit SecY, partial [Parachlamydiales bacterium]
QKVIVTLLLLVVCRIGAAVPVPGINAEAAAMMFRQATGGSQNLFQMMDMFSGGAFAQMTVTALGVMPYISASIILQLLVALVPSIQREMKENPEMGKRKIGKWTRLGTMALALFQSALFAKYLVTHLHSAAHGLIISEFMDVQFMGLPWLFYLTVMLTMTTGTLFLMWVGERISEKGVGNGVSLIITLGILSSLPSTIGSVIKQLNLESQEAGHLSFSSLVVLILVFVLVIIGTILVIQGQRKIPLQYARRPVVGASQGNSYLPLKINYAGVIPVIFAASILMFPATVGQFLGSGSWLGRVSSMLVPGSWAYTVCYIGLILFFTFFWTATQFHPEQIASDMKKNGAFVPGIRQGKPTEDFLHSTMGRVTLLGGIFLALIAIFPMIVSKLMNVDHRISHFFGGTSLLILVGVILDTMKQIESHLLMQRYEGFMKKGRLTGR